MHKDATGRPIAKGSYIAYAVSVGSGGGVKFGAVVRLKEHEYEYNEYDPNTQTYSKVPAVKYSVQVVSAECPSWGPNKDKWVIQGKTQEGKPARVQSIDRLERVIILEPDQMHQEAKEVLDKELHERGTI